MSLLAGAVAAASVLAALTWGLLVAICWRSVRSLRALEDLSPSPPARWPGLSVVLPACNEADTLEAALRSRLATDYPDVEFIVVDDRSTDGTGAIARRLAQHEPRLRVIRVDELPPGWLGKVHAMHQGALVARGDFLLFSDADVHVAPGALRTAVAWAEQQGYDHLALMPVMQPTGFWLDTVLSVFARLIAIAGRVYAVEDAGSRASAGSGAFNLERRAAFARSGGFEEIRLEVADDAALGALMKRSGARCTMLYSRGQVSLTFYRSLMDMAHKGEKNAYAVLGRCRLWRVVAGSAALIALDLLPWIGLLPVGLVWPPLLAGVALALATGSNALVNRLFKRPLLPALFPVVGSTLFSWMMLRGGLLGWRAGGIWWRGTFYSAAELRAGQRFKLL